MSNPFHLAIPVNDLAKAADFYENTLGCERGRESESWIDFNLFGHQLVCHFVETSIEEYSNPVDGDNIPVPHFGVILNFDQFDLILEKLKEKNQAFVVEPKTRFAGQPGEQRTMFFKDPSGNAIEFKAFKDLDSLFKS
tara:strand:- start:592 stop:1005 length:414 start_codon:yes stop_codon:yes gene_type:complete